jgi:hypothetical protein
MRGGLRIKDVPIVVQSGNKFATRAQEDASHVLLLRKPFRFADLTDSIDHAVWHTSHGHAGLPYANEPSPPQSPL